MLRKALIRPLLIFAAFGVGILFPELVRYNWLIRYLLIAMLYLIFLPVELTSLRLQRSHIYLLAANIGLALVLWGAAMLSGNRLLAEIAFFTAAAPTASAAPVIMKFLGGNASYVVTSFVLTNSVIAVLLSLLLPLLITGEMNPAGFIRSAVNIFVLIGVPMAGAVISRKLYPASRDWPKRCGNLSFMLWVVLLCIISGSAMNFFYSNRGSLWYYWWSAGISLLVCAVNFSVGYWLGGREFCREASQSLGQKNTSFTIVLAATFASPLAAMGPTFYVLWHNLWNAWQLFKHDKKRSASEETDR